MARDSEVPPPSGPQQSGARGGPHEQPYTVERYGILGVDRHRKDDGRALLLYTREDPDRR